MATETTPAPVNGNGALPPTTRAVVEAIQDQTALTTTNLTTVYEAIADQSAKFDTLIEVMTLNNEKLAAVHQAVRELVDQLREGALFPSDGITLERDSSRQMKPKVTVHRPAGQIDGARVAAVQQMQQLLTEFPDPPAKAAAPK